MPTASVSLACGRAFLCAFSPFLSAFSVAGSELTADSDLRTALDTAVENALTSGALCTPLQLSASHACAHATAVDGTFRRLFVLAIITGVLRLIGTVPITTALLPVVMGRSAMLGLPLCACVGLWLALAGRSLAWPPAQCRQCLWLR